MWNVTGKRLATAGMLFFLGGCGSFYSIQDVMSGNAFDAELGKAQSRNMSNAPLRSPRSVVVCRGRQCAPANLSMSREYVYNSLVHLFENNNHQTALICKADSATRTCTESYLTMPLKVGVTPAHMYIDSVNITDVIIGRKNQQINLVLNYNVTYNGQSPDCTPAKSVSFARNVNHIMLEDVGYRCKMTTIGYSTVKTVFSIDYIDLDFGFIGGYYSIGVSGPAYGGGTGYMLLRLPKYSEKLSPVLVDPEKGNAPKSQARTKAKKAQTTVSSTLSGSDDSGLTQSGVQIFPLELKKAAAPLPNSEISGSSADLAAPAEASEPAPKAAEEDKTSDALRPEAPTQIAPATYSVTSGNKLAEELKKANTQQ